MATVRTHKGKFINMDLLVKSNEHVPALSGGGAKMNARGDLLGENGKIVMTKEQLADQYNKQPGAVKQMSLNQINAKMSANKKEAAKNEVEIKSHITPFMNVQSQIAQKNPTPAAVKTMPVTVAASDFPENDPFEVKNDDDDSIDQTQTKSEDKKPKRKLVDPKE